MHNLFYAYNIYTVLYRRGEEPVLWIGADYVNLTSNPITRR